MIEAHAPRITLDVIEAVALPTTSAAEVEGVIARWRFINDSPIDFRHSLLAADLNAADLVVVEVATQGATAEDLREAFVAAGLAPCGLVDAIRVVAATEPSRWQRFPFLCLATIESRPTLKAALVDCAASNMVVVMEIVLLDDERQPELGWSSHSFVLARHSSSVP